jgi:putative nucleotidyltransferase with HDIG domain
MKNFSAKEADFEDRALQTAALIDAFEGYQSPHASRIAAIANKVAQKFNLASHDRFSLRQAALFHDIGESVMNRDYIKSGSVLRADERMDMQRHTVIGEQESAKRGLNRAVQLLVRWHHEWWNGAGYPDALEREQIPLAARILRVADTFSAMTDNRPYRAAISEDEARSYLTEWAGIEFDPKVVKFFLALEDFAELKSFAERQNDSIHDERIENQQEETLLFQTQF